MNATDEQPGIRAAGRFAARMRAFRLVGGVTQAELADRMRDRGHAYVQQTVNKIEQGERVVRINEAVDLADALGASLADLIGEDS